MPLRFRCYSLLLLISFFYSCQTSQKQKQEEKEPVSVVELHYAKGFSIANFENYVCVKVAHPWAEDTTIWATYYLVKDENIETPNKKYTIKIPVQNLAVSSCTHFPFIEKLGFINNIVAICSPELVYNEIIREKYKQKEIISLGDPFNLNIERLLQAKPDVFVQTGYNGQDDFVNQLENYGISVLLNNEWLEETPLGRAEWLKFFAAFFDCQEMADSIFTEIEINYINAVEYAKTYENKPKVMPGSNFRGTWYVPGGRTYMAHLFADAGADYVYATDTSTGSLPLNFETALKLFSKSDIWLNAPCATLKELNGMDERHKLFLPLKNKQVYAFLAKTKSGGANDFWESAVLKPDIILRDMIWAIHEEEKSTDYQPQFILQLQ